MRIKIIALMLVAVFAYSILEASSLILDTNGNILNATPNVTLRQSKLLKTAGNISFISDGDISTFYGVGENEHYGGWVNLSLVYNFANPVNIQEINYTREMRTSGSSSDTEKQIEKVIVWDSSGQHTAYQRNVTYRGGSGTAPGGKLENKSISGPFNEIIKVEFGFYASSSGGSSDRFTRIRLYDLDISGREVEIINCTKDEDCGLGFCMEDDKYCDNGNLFYDFTENKCINPRTPQAYCEESKVKTKIANCVFGCDALLGECIVLNFFII